MLDNIFLLLRKVFRKQTDEFIQIVNNNTLRVDRKAILRTLVIAKYRCGFRQLVDMTAIDYDNNHHKSRFSIIYIIRNYELNQLLEINVQLQETDKIPTAIEIFKNADWYEREIHEMFGIQFRNRVATPNLLLPEDDMRFPLRKSSNAS